MLAELNDITTRFFICGQEKKNHIIGYFDPYIVVDVYFFKNLRLLQAHSGDAFK